jgi:hypothetical protein
MAIEVLADLSRRARVPVQPAPHSHGGIPDLTGYRIWQKTHHTCSAKIVGLKCPSICAHSRAHSRINQAAPENKARDWERRAVRNPPGPPCLALLARPACLALKKVWWLAPRFFVAYPRLEISASVGKVPDAFFRFGGCLTSSASPQSDPCSTREALFQSLEQLVQSFLVRRSHRDEPHA